MKVFIYVTVGADSLLKRISSDPVMSKVFKGTLIAAASLDFDSDQFQRFLEISADTGFDWVVDVEFSKRELDEFDFLEVKPAILLKLGDLEDSLNYFLIETSQPREIWKSSPIQVPRGLVVGGRKPPKANQICSLNTASEYVLGSEARQTFEYYLEDLPIEIIPVFSRRELWEAKELSHLFTWEVAPKVDIGPLIWHELYKDRLRWRRLGCLCFSDLRLLPDICRTAEPWSSWENPGWVVHSRVREELANHGIVGWRYLPVMETGSHQFEIYSEKMEKVREVLFANPRYSMK